LLVSIFSVKVEKENRHVDDIENSLTLEDFLSRQKNQILGVNIKAHFVEKIACSI
jgi:hypothetical protein